MLALLLKIALAIFACAVAVLGVSDLKTVRPLESADDKSWVRRITTIGIFKIGCAIATLILIAVNEEISYSASVDASKKASDASQRSAEQAKSLQTKIDQSREALVANIIQLRMLSRTHEYLVTTLDSALDRAGIARVPPEQIDSTYFFLNFESGEKLVPKRGDSFEWSFACQMGALPTLPSNQQDRSCAQAAYGRLMANGSAFPLTSESGHRPYFGSRSTGEQMAYRSPAENGLCPATAARLRPRPS